MWSLAKSENKPTAIKLQNRSKDGYHNLFNNLICDCKNNQTPHNSLFSGSELKIAPYVLLVSFTPKPTTVFEDVSSVS